MRGTIPVGHTPTGIVRNTVPLRASSTLTVLEPLLVTNTLVLPLLARSLHMG